MRALIVHLSDFHITSDNAVLCSHTTPIASAVKTIESGIDICIVVASGDISLSGAKQEYVQALAFFVSLKDALSRQLSEGEPSRSPLLKFVLVPGNHDCNFSAASSVRQVIVDTILSDPTKANDSEMAKICTSVQDNFFELLDLLDTTDSGFAADSHNHLYWEYVITHGEERMLFRCCNTAWLSQLHEQQGKLYFPPEVVKTTEADFAVLVLHHTLNWLENNNMRALRSRIDETADVVLTGHDHEATWKSQGLPSRLVNFMFEGGSLQYPDNPMKRDFNALVVDTKASRLKVAHFSWDAGTGIYAPSNKSRMTSDSLAFEWVTLPTARSRTGQRPSMSKDFSAFLYDLGIDLHHPRTGRVALPDIFVFPDLCEVRIPNNGIRRFIRGDGFLHLLENECVLLISGDSQCGKTALSITTCFDPPLTTSFDPPG